MNYYRGTTESQLLGQYFTTSRRLATGYALLSYFMWHCLHEDESPEPAVVGTFCPHSTVVEDPCDIPNMYIIEKVELLSTEVIYIPPIVQVPKFLLVLAACDLWASEEHGDACGFDYRGVRDTEMAYIFCQHQNANEPVLYQYETSAIGRLLGAVEAEMVALTG